MRLLLSLVLVFFTAATRALQSYNWSITDQSPLITYTPAYIGDNTTTWNNSYSLTSYDATTGDYARQMGYGRSSHTSMLSGATASVGFKGTAVYIWGSAYNLYATVYIDGVAMGYSSGSQEVVAVVEGLEDRWHQVEVEVRGLAPVSIEGMTFTSTTTAKGAMYNVTVDPSTAGRDGQLDLTGHWNVEYTTAQDETNYTSLTATTDADASLTLSPPSNTTAMYLYGIVDPYTRPYFVDVRPPLSNASNAVANQTYNGTNVWASADQVLFAAQMEVGVQYTVTVTFDVDGRYYSNNWHLGSIVYVQTNESVDGQEPGSNSGSSSGLGKGAIAGIVIGAVAAALIGAVLIFTAWGRRLTRGVRRVLFPCATRSRARRPSIVSSHSYEGIDPYPHGSNARPMAMTARSSDSSVAKTGLDAIAPPTPIDTSISATGLTGSGAMSSMMETTSPLSLNRATSSPVVATPTMSSSAAVSRREKEESLALLLPHLTSAQGGDGALSPLSTPGSSSRVDTTRTSGQPRMPETGRSSIMVPSIRDTDGGPMLQVDEAGRQQAILPPEYDPSWARR